MNVLVIAPHPDDEAIGCGGALCLHADRGDRVSVVVLSSGELGLKHLSRDEAWRIREREATAAAEVLGITSLTFLRRRDWFVGDAIDESAGLLQEILSRDLPDLIYLPHPCEWHPDHKAALPITLEGVRRIDGYRPALRTYEVWTPSQEYDVVEDISSVIRRKMRAIRCYRSQLGHFRYDRAIRGLNQYRGSLAGRCAYAEVFQDVTVLAEPESKTTGSAADLIQ